MSRVYSADLRLRILKAYDEGVLIEDVIEQYAVSHEGGDCFGRSEGPVSSAVQS